MNQFITLARAALLNIAQIQEFRETPRLPPGLEPLRRTVSVDELSTEFATDPPRQPASTARIRQENGEFVRNVEIFGDHPHPAFGHVNDRAVTRQGANPELDLRHAPICSTIASASIC